MNDDETNLCRSILNQLKTRKYFNMFWNHEPDLTNPNIEHPINFDVISSKLDTNTYTNISTFISDIATCIENGRNGYPEGSIRHAAAEQLQTYFEDILNEVNPLGGPVSMPLQYFTKEYIRKCVPPIPDINTQPKNTDKEPGSIIFTLERDPDDLNALYRDIKLLTSTSLIFELAAFTKKLQPDIITIRNEVSINVTLLLPQNRPSMRKFVTHLLRKAATGEVDANSRPFGHTISPIHIYDRGFPLNPHQNVVPVK